MKRMDKVYVACEVVACDGRLTVREAGPERRSFRLADRDLPDNRRPDQFVLVRQKLPDFSILKSLKLGRKA